MSFFPPCPDLVSLLAEQTEDSGGMDSPAVRQHLSSCLICEARQAAIQESAGEADPDRPTRAFGRDAVQYHGQESSVVPFGVADAPVSVDSEVERKDFSPGLKAGPRQLGKYRLISELGRGGMGIVYAAVHVNLNKPVAVKVIRPDFADSPRALARFRREALAIGDLSHANVVTATDADEAEGYHFLVMEYVDGLDLASILTRTGPMPIAEACEVVRQAAVGMEYIHERGRVHRDLKPSNLMLTADGVVKILDLGLASLRADTPMPGGLSCSNMIMGTADYMAPEQWVDSHAVDIRADIYSLGCTLHHLIVGVPPFYDSQNGLFERKRRAHAESPIPIWPGRPTLPTSLGAILERMMAKHPDDRYSTPLEAAEALQDFTAGADCVKLLAAAREDATQRWVARQPSDSLDTGSFQPRPSAMARFLAGAPTRSKFLGSWRWPIVVTSVVVLAALTALILAVSTTPKPEPPPAPLAIAANPATEDAGPQPGRWYNLLQREPTRLMWNDHQFNHRFDYMADQKTLTVKVPNESLVSFGEVSKSGYKLRLGIEQLGWSGGVGIFFGYHDYTLGTRTGKRAQLLELRPRRDRAPKDGYFITRAWIMVEEVNGVPKIVSRNEMKAASIPSPAERQEHILSIDVDATKLAEVRWDSKPLPEIVGGDIEQTAKIFSVDFTGHFGVYNRNSHATFGNAEILLFQRPTR